MIFLNAKIYQAVLLSPSKKFSPMKILRKENEFSINRKLRLRNISLLFLSFNRMDIDTKNMEKKRNSLIHRWNEISGQWGRYEESKQSIPNAKQILSNR